MRYLVIGYSRTGTTRAHLELMGHPHVSALDGELRPTPFFSKGLMTFTHNHLAPAEIQCGHRVLFDAMTRIRNPAATAWGAKTACNSPAAATNIVAVLREHFHDLRVIHCVRKDVVAHYGSTRMVKSGIYHSWQGTAKPKIITIRRRPLIRFANWVAKLNSVLGDLQHSHDYLRLETYSAESLFSFLDLETIESRNPSKKVLPPPDQYIANYAQCQRWIYEGPRTTDQIPPLNVIWRKLWS